MPPFPRPCVFVPPLIFPTSFSVNFRLFHDDEKWFRYRARVRSSWIEKRDFSLQKRGREISTESEKVGQKSQSLLGTKKAEIRAIKSRRRPNMFARFLKNVLAVFWNVFEGTFEYFPASPSLIIQRSSDYTYMSCYISWKHHKAEVTNQTETVVLPEFRRHILRQSNHGNSRRNVRLLVSLFTQVPRLFLPGIT